MSPAKADPKRSLFLSTTSLSITSSSSIIRDYLLERGANINATLTKETDPFAMNPTDFAIYESEYGDDAQNKKDWDQHRANMTINDKSPLEKYYSDSLLALAVQIRPNYIQYLLDHGARIDAATQEAARSLPEEYRPLILTSETPKKKEGSI